MPTFHVNVSRRVVTTVEIQADDEQAALATADKISKPLPPEGEWVPDKSSYEFWINDERGETIADSWS